MIKCLKKGFLDLKKHCQRLNLQNFSHYFVIKFPKLYCLNVLKINLAFHSNVLWYWLAIEILAYYNYLV